MPPVFSSTDTVEVQQDDLGPGGVREFAGAADEPQRLVAVGGDMAAAVAAAGRAEGFLDEQRIARIVLDEQHVSQLADGSDSCDLLVFRTGS